MLCCSSWQQRLLFTSCCGSAAAAAATVRSAHPAPAILATAANGMCGGTRRAYSQQPSNAAATAVTQRPKLHWTEEFKIRSPKVPADLLRRESVVAIDIESDAFVDRRVAFLLRRWAFGGPFEPRVRGVGKILSWCCLASVPYLLFCKWAGGSPLFGDMPTYAIPAAVAGVSLGYLGLNLALERAVLGRRIFSVALDELDPSVVYITTLPVGGWLHGSYRSYATRLDNINVELTGGNWAKLTFKNFPDKDRADDFSLSLPVGRSKLFVGDARAMAAFSEACKLSMAESVAAGKSDARQFEQVTLPHEADIERHLQSTLEQKPASQEAAEPLGKRD